MLIARYITEVLEVNHIGVYEIFPGETLQYAIVTFHLT